MLRFASFIRRSISRRFIEAGPGEAKLSSPGFERASATSSATLFAATPGLATRMLGTSATSVTAIRSFCVSMGMLRNTPGLIAIVPMLPRKIV